MGLTYNAAGVNIAAGNESIQRVKSALKDTFSSAVLTDIGGFGAMYDLSQLMKDYQRPVLVQSVDGVGTKMMIAKMMNDYSTIGIDLVSATVNDIIVLGAKPLTLLDYIAADRLDPNTIETIILGMVKACKEEGISLVGGEMAEMPGTYQRGEHDLVGLITGVLEKERAILGKEIKEGDLVLALPSSGLHTNGYSLARKLFFDTLSYSADHYLPDLQMSIGEALLKPHINYAKPILHALSHQVAIKGMAHITGGGVLENIPRVLPQGLGVEIKRNACPVLPIFSCMQGMGNIAEEEMYRTFNMGIGFVMIVDSSVKTQLTQHIAEVCALPVYEIGHVVSGNRTVRLV
jgi:phosphoribosylformylglycinamidine cyclo-ligase